MTVMWWRWLRRDDGDETVNRRISDDVDDDEDDNDAVITMTIIRESARPNGLQRRYRREKRIKQDKVFMFGSLTSDLNKYENKHYS